MRKVLIFAAILILSTSLLPAGGGSQQSAIPAPDQIPAYLNLDGYIPIVRQGNDVSITMWTRRDSIANSDIYGQWTAQYIQNVLNIRLVIEETYLDTYVERRNLALAANDLPDIMINQGFGVTDLVRYGQGEGMFLALSDYISPRLTPTLQALVDGDPNVRAFNTTPDGKMYTIAMVGGVTRYPTGENRVFINTRWMQAAGIREVPRTLDQFIDMLRRFNQLTPQQVGAQGRITPMISANEHDRRFFMNALGFIGGCVWGMDPAVDIRNRRVAIPAGEPEWEDFIRLYHTMYSEGLIHPDYFTMAANRTEARAHFAEGNAGVSSDSAPYVSMPNTFAEWVSAAPLTSSANSTAAVARGPNVGVGTFIVSSRTRQPHVIMRLLDWMYSPEGSVLTQNGPIAGHPHSFGYGGFALNETRDNFFHPDVRSGRFESDWHYRVNAIQISQETPRDTSGSFFHMMRQLGVANPELREFDLTDGDDHYYVMVYNANNGYFFDRLPPAFLSETQVRRAADLRSVLENHVRAETARFVVGQRPLNQIPQFFAELRALGMDEYRNIYTDVYRDYINNRTDWSTYRIDYN